MSGATARVLRDPDGLWPTLAAVGYALAAWAGGWLLLLFAGTWPPLVLGTLLLAHGMVIAAYLVHECAHNAVFRQTRHNECLGTALNWLTGACYGTFADLRRKHMRHHVDNADVIAVDYRAWLRSHPRALRLVQALEWAYVPAVDLLMHALLVLAPFVLPSRRAQRARVLRVLAVRLVLLAALAWLQPRALVLYALAYLLFLSVLRFMDAFQHNYELVQSLDDGPGAPHRGDRAYEHAHTFSNPLSLRWPSLNLLTLNFAYHNAHHHRPAAPWYRLPGMHRALYGDDDAQVIPLRQQLRAYHRTRVPRILSEEDESTDFRARMRRGEGVGAYGVSFLTAF